MRRLLLAFVCASAASLALGGCARRARLVITRFDGLHPPQALVRCLTAGLDSPKFTWKLGTGLKQPGVNLPKDEGALVVQWNDGTPSAGLAVGCLADDGRGVVGAAGSLAPLTVTRATVAGGLVTVDGSGFGTTVAGDDGVYLLAGGASLHADPTCAKASWTDAHLVACAPPLPPGRYELRVQSGDRLASLAQPIEVKK
jgi:hypothetical protein